MALKISNAGIRGQFHELTPSRAARFAQAYATYRGGGDLLLAADTRPSGLFLREAVAAGLSSCGANVFDCGILPTPILQWLIRRHRYSGGISITANHNTADWNSLIFLNGEGAYLNDWEAEELFNVSHSARFSFQPHDRLGMITQDCPNLEDYFGALAIEEPIPGRKYVVDCSNGFSRDLLQQVQRSLGVTLIPLFAAEENSIWKDPEPTRRNAGFLATVVKETGSSGGFLVNTDASRLLMVDERGEALSEELTFPLFASILLEDEKRDLVTSYSTSKVIDQVAKAFGVKVFRTDVGQPSIIQMVIEIKAAIGGEGNGSTAFAPFSYGFDSFFAMRTIIRQLGKKGLEISHLAEAWKAPEIIKKSIHLAPDRIYAALDRIEALFPRRLRLKDGFYVEEGGQWLCIRASSTVSIIRIVGEGPDMENEVSRIVEALA